MATVSFTAIAQPNPGGVLFVEIPKKVVTKLGAGKRVPVRVTLNGARYRSTIAVYGGRYYLPARKEIRDAAKRVAGGRARVSLEVDTAPRTVEVPTDLARAQRGEAAVGVRGYVVLAAEGVRRIDHVGEASRDTERASREDRRRGTRQGVGRLAQG